MPDWIMYALIALAALDLILIVLVIILYRTLSQLRGMLAEQRALVKSAFNSTVSEANENERRHFELLGAISKERKETHAAVNTEQTVIAADDDMYMDVMMKLASISGRLDKLTQNAAKENADPLLVTKAAMFDKLIALVESGADKATIVRTLKGK